MDNQAQAGIGTVGVTIITTKPSDVATLDLLTKVAAAKLKGVIVLGFDENGQVYQDCNIDDGGDALWLLAKAQHKLLAHEGPK